MSTGNTTTTTNNNNNSSVFGSNYQYNPSQFGVVGLPNSGYYAGLGGYPIGGFGQISPADGDFSSLFSSLQSSGTFGPGLYNTLGPNGVNPQAMALASEAASAGTTLLLNKLAPLNLPPEALYSSSVFGNLNSGISILDTMTAFANGIAGTLPVGGSFARLVNSAGPALGAMSGILGIAQGIRAYSNKPTVAPQSSPLAIDDYMEELEG